MTKSACPGRLALDLRYTRRLKLIAALFALVGAVQPALALDERGFPSTEAELDEWFPPSEGDADPMSPPEDPPPIQGSAMPPTLREQAEAERGDTSVHDPRSLEERFQDAQKEYGLTLKEVRAVLKRPVAPVPPPPDYELECNDDLAINVLTEQLVRAYVKKAANPEFDALTRLLDVRRHLQLLGVKTLETYQVELAERLLTKATKLIETYGKQRNKVLATLGFMHEALRLTSLVGGSVKQELFSEIAGWLGKLIPDLLTDIRTKHDYRAVSAALALAQAVIDAGDGAAGVNPDQLVAEIEAAMAFELSLELYVKSTGANGHAEEWTLKSVFPLQATLTKGKHMPIPQVLLSGTGNGHYASYSEQDGKIRMTAPGFEVVARVKEFDACSGSAVLAFDRFFAETETYHFTSGPPADLPMIKSAFVIFHGDKPSTDGYEFKLPVVNLTAKPVDTVIAESMGVFVFKLTVKLTHQPK